MVIDTKLIIWLNHHMLPGSLPALQLLSESATYLNVAITLIFLVGYIRTRSKEKLVQFAILIGVLIVSALLTWVLKSVFDRERPFYVHPEIIKYTHGGDSSFPSGHTLESFALATAVSFFLTGKQKWLMIPLFGWALLIGYTRVALGVHYPTDVLGGMLFGILTGFVIPRFVNNRVLRSSLS